MAKKSKGIVFLSLGVGMWSVAEGMLKDADEVFLTAGEFTYTGRYDANSYDNNEALVTAYESLKSGGILEDEDILYTEEQKHQKCIVIVKLSFWKFQIFIQ